MTSHRAPGQAYRKGITMMELAEMFPTEESAQAWLEARIWRDGRVCPRCRSERTIEAAHAKMPYWCSDCRSYFSVRVGTLLEGSKVSLRKWVWATYLHLTNLKGVSSMKLHRDIGVSQPTAWFMLQRIRKAFEGDDEPPFAGPVELDEAYIGGKERNKHKARKLKAGRGPSGKTAILGARDHRTGKVKAQMVGTPDKTALLAFIDAHVAHGAAIYTDGASAYNTAGSMLNGIRHEAVHHSVGEYVKGMVHTNGVESFWAMLKRGYH
ncbi:MAG: IS1595 family transposase, partial [Chloroflexota bacterium]|nr:IS1595 family transposase [Chloroflexota bacterium]